MCSNESKCRCNEKDAVIEAYRKATIAISSYLEQDGALAINDGLIKCIKSSRELLNNSHLLDKAQHQECHKQKINYSHIREIDFNNFCADTCENYEYGIQHCLMESDMINCKAYKLYNAISNNIKL